MSKSLAIIQFLCSLIGGVAFVLYLCGVNVPMEAVVIPIVVYGLISAGYYVYYTQTKKQMMKTVEQKDAFNKINGIAIALTITVTFTLIGYCQDSGYNWLFGAGYTLLFVQSLLILTPFYPKNEE